MRKFLIFICIVHFITIYSCRSYELNLNGKEYLSEDPIKSEYLSFINDSVCIYSQVFHCDIDEKYRNTIIQCKYKVEDNLIYLTNVVSPKHLEGSTCNIIPDSILRACDLIYNDTPENPFVLDKRVYLTKADAYGMVNNINESDTLLIYKHDILYAKVLTCISTERRRASFIAFTEIGKKKMGNKKLRKLMRTGKLPVNNNF